jgi:hypothetical protein
MKLQVYGVPAEKEEIVRLKLIDNDWDDIRLYAVDEDGGQVDGGWLLKFKSNGTILRVPRVSDKLGFVLDARGRIEFEDE